MMRYMNKERDRIAKGFTEKEEIERIPNMIAVNSLFEAVAHGILSDKGAIDDNQSLVLASNLAKCFAVESKHPLKMKGHLGKNNWQDCPVKAVDCPEWLVYVEKANNAWYLWEQKSGREAQRLIESEWTNVRTGRVVALHNLKLVSNSLLGNKGKGFIKISKAEAAEYKLVQVIWE